MKTLSYDVRDKVREKMCTEQKKKKEREREWKRERDRLD